MVSISKHVVPFSIIMGLRLAVLRAACALSATKRKGY